MQLAGEQPDPMQSAGRNATDYRRNEASDVPDGPAVQPLEFKLAACRHEGRAARPRVEKGQVDAPLYKHPELEVAPLCSSWVAPLAWTGIHQLRGNSYA